MDSTSTALLVADITYKASVYAAFISLIAVVVGTVLGYFLSFYFDRKKRNEERHIDSRSEAFSKLLLLLIWFDTSTGDKDIENMKVAISNTELYGSKELSDLMYKTLTMISNKKWQGNERVEAIDKIKTLMKKELKMY